VHVRLVTAAKLARIEVEDDGEAPSEDAVGDAFGHTHAGTSRSPRTGRSSGGIGPVLVRSIVAAHGGTLRAEKLSIDGVPRGARVVVSLPTHECATREIVH
jgi:signal transduction histidine kinase